MTQDVRLYLTFVVPCYNEAENVTGSVAEIMKAANDACCSSYEIVIVNDCSMDNTAEVAGRLAAQDSRIRIVTNQQNLGLGGAYKSGLKHARGIYVIMIPGDNAHPSAGIAPILRKAGEADIVIPYVSNTKARSGFRRFASRAFTAIVNAISGLDVPYFNGLVLHKVDLIRGIEIRTNGFAYQAEALVKLINGGATYVDIPVEISDRRAGKSGAFALKNFYRVTVTICSLWREMRRLSKHAT